MRPTDQELLATLLHATVDAVAPIQGGYTPAERWHVRLHDGTTAFVKIGVTPFTVDALRREIRNLATLGAQPFAPVVRAAAPDRPRPLLVLEDLTHARWPPPWHPGDRRCIAPP